MYCSNCGTQNPDTVMQCTNCGQRLGQPAAPAGQVPPHIPNYLVQAILVTLFCCLPFGIVSIIYAAQVNGKVSGGDIRGAMESSQKAKTWCWVAFGLGLVVVLIQIIMMIVGGGLSAAGQY
jgi:hypothetical protein